MLFEVSGGLASSLTLFSDEAVLDPQPLSLIERSPVEPMRVTCPRSFVKLLQVVSIAESHGCQFSSVGIISY